MTRFISYHDSASREGYFIRKVKKSLGIEGGGKEHEVGTQ